MAPFIITADIGLAGKFLMVLFIFLVINPQFDVMHLGQVLQTVQHRGESFAKRHRRMQTAVGLPEKREDLVFLLQPGRFFSDALFEH